MTTETQYERAVQAADFIRSRAKELPRVALVLGSGLGAFADELDEAVAIPYADIPCFPVSTVEGHAGRLVLGKVGGAPVAAMQGRFHYYEGYGLDEVTLPMRVFHLLGVRAAVITNAAGGLNSDFAPGTLMLISDHLNPTGLSPLRGANDNRFGPRFPDMTEVYCRQYQELAIDAAQSISLDLRRGVYCLLPGPHYETPAEIRMYRTLGADAVGMSTVPEAIVARHMGINILGISCITNLAAGMLDQPINHEEVMEIGARVGEKFKQLLRQVIPGLGV
jgi:purine-nucleoside phosphorylase